MDQTGENKNNNDDSAAKPAEQESEASETVKCIPVQEGVETTPEMKSGDSGAVPEPMITKTVHEEAVAECIRDAATYIGDPEVKTVENAIEQVKAERETEAKTSLEKKAGLDIKGVPSKPDESIEKELEARMVAPPVKTVPEQGSLPETPVGETVVPSPDEKTEEPPRPLTQDKASEPAEEKAPEVPLTVATQAEGAEEPAQKPGGPSAGESSGGATGEQEPPRPMVQETPPEVVEEKAPETRLTEPVEQEKAEEITAAEVSTPKTADEAPVEKASSQESTTAKEVAPMAKKQEKDRKPDAGKPEPDAADMSFGSPNEYWNALLAVICFLSMMVSYFLVGMMTSSFIQNLNFISSHIPIPSVITALGSIFVLNWLNIVIYTVIVLGVFYLLHKAVKKYTKLPTFFFISFLVHFYTVFLFIMVLYEYNSMFRLFENQ